MLAPDQREPGELVGYIERLLEELDALPDAGARSKATEAVRALLELYGAGLERMVQEIALRDDGEIANAFAGDELITHLLLLHGLHPVPLEQRVAQALDEVRPYLESHGGNVEVLEVQDTVIRVRLQGSCSGCPSSTMTLRLAIENAVQKAAPEIEQVIAEDASPPSSLPLLQIQPMPAPSPPEPDGEVEWTIAGGLRDVVPGRAIAKNVSGQRILFLTLGESMYAYRPGCPSCGGSLEQAPLEGVELRCGGCGQRYDVLRAGRCLDSPQLHLEPIPLLVGEDGLAKLALAVPAGSQ
ncbi:MAG: NifU family protein [Solirubrobacterales bacterium]|nr:NifU family protein [Solirubrobacterales bacterium]